jgi:hypothetical protein
MTDRDGGSGEAEVVELVFALGDDLVGVDPDVAFPGEHVSGKSCGSSDENRGKVKTRTLENRKSAHPVLLEHQVCDSCRSF